jgi:hypothetical protein
VSEDDSGVIVHRSFDGVTAEKANADEADANGKAIVFPVWPGAGPGTDCEDWPYLQGFSFVATNGTDYETNTAELEVSFIPNRSSAVMLVPFTTDRIILVHEQLVSHYTQLYTPPIAFPGVPAMFPRLYLRVGPSRTAWKFHAWWRWGTGTRKVGPSAP